MDLLNKIREHWYICLVILPYMNFFFIFKIFILKLSSFLFNLQLSFVCLLVSTVFWYLLSTGIYCIWYLLSTIYCYWYLLSTGIYCYCAFRQILQVLYCNLSACYHKSCKYLGYINPLSYELLCRELLNYDFLVGGGVPYPIFFRPNLLVRFKLGYTQNFAALGHVEVP